MSVWNSNLVCYIVFVHGNVMTARTSDVITAYCSGVGTDMMVARPSPAHHINRAHVHVHVHVSYRAARLIDRQAACRWRVDRFFYFIPFLLCSTWSPVQNLNNAMYCTYVHDITHLTKHYWYEHEHGDGRPVILWSACISQLRWRHRRIPWGRGRDREDL